MKSKLSKRFLAILLSCLLVMASFAGTFTVGATTDEDAIRAAFEEYVASTVITDSGLSSTYNDAGLIAYLKGKGYDGISIVGAGTTTPESYLQHSVSGFKTGVEGYENLFAAKDGYVAVVLSYNGANIGCVATLPAYVYDYSDVDTISSDADFADTNGDGYMDTYTGSAELVVLNSQIASGITWGDNAANIKAIVSKNGQQYSTSFHEGAAFKTAKLPNLKAIRFENGSFAFGGNNGVLQNTKVTHVSVPLGQYMIPHHFANGVNTLEVVENLEKTARIGWAGFAGGNYTTMTLGQGHGEWYVQSSGLTTNANKNSGVTPVFNFLFSVSAVANNDGGNRRWHDKLDGTEGPLPIVYFPSEAALNTFKTSALYTKPTSMNADYRVATNNLTRVSASVKAAVDKLSGVVPTADGALLAVKAGVTLPDGYTLAWAEDTFASANLRVTGTLVLSDGTNNVKFNVSIPTMAAEGTIEENFNAYVASTVIKDSGLSSTYSDAGLVAALLDKGHAVTVVDSYLQHSQSGFTTAVAGYENLFAAKDGYVSVLLDDVDGNRHALIAKLPAYTYNHTADITTVSKAEDFTVTDGTITAYNGSANLLVIDKPVSSAITWGDNAANIKAIVYSGGQQFTKDNAHDGKMFGASKLPNLAAFYMENGSFEHADINMFKDNNAALTHVSLPATGVYVLPNHFLWGRAGVVRLDNTAKTERFGWCALSGTKLNTIEGGIGRGELWTDANAFNTNAGTFGVTPVFKFHHSNPNIGGSASGSSRWNANYPPVIYLNQATYDKIMASTMIGGKENATYRTATASILKLAVTVADKVANVGEVLPAEDAALVSIKNGLTLGDDVTLAWVADTFKVQDGKVTGTLALSDGTNTFPIAVSANAKKPEGTVKDLFANYVKSTVITDSGLSSTYNDAALMDLLISKGHAVTLVDSYLQHADSGFVTNASGYENLFAAKDGCVAVLLKDSEGTITGYTAPIPAYTYKHYDIDTISKADEFTVVDGTITAYNGSAEVLVLDKPVASNFTLANGGNVKVVIINNGQQFTSAFHQNFANKMPNLLAARFENATVSNSGDIGMFSGAAKLTHLALGKNWYMVPHHFAVNTTSLVRVDNEEYCERFGWTAFTNSKLHTIEAGKARGVWHTNQSCFYTKAGEYGVTPVFKLHCSNSIDGDNPGGARWNATYPPIIYSNYEYADFKWVKDVPGVKLAATWKKFNPALLAAANAQTAVNGLIATTDGEDVKAAALAVLGEGYTANWASYELNGMDASGVLTVTNGTNTFNILYNGSAMQMVNGASIRYGAPAGIRFATRLNGIAKLEAEGYTVKVGTIIAINSAIGSTEFTKDALTAAGVKYLDVKTAIWAEDDSFDCEKLTFNVVHGIPAESYTTELSARTYVEATKDGVTKTWYSDYSELNNTRSIREVAVKVYDQTPDVLKPNLDVYINGAQ